MDIRDGQRIKQIRDNTEKMADAFTRIADALERLTEPQTDLLVKTPRKSRDSHEKEAEPQTEENKIPEYAPWRDAFDAMDCQSK